MDHIRSGAARSGIALVAIAAIMTACAGTGSPSASVATTPSAAATTAAASPSAASASASASAETGCATKQVGPIIRCENFYTDYWPKINASLDDLYQQAKSTNGGQIVVWDWYELSPDVIKAFTTRFPGLKIKTQGLQYNLSSAIISAHATGTETTDVISGDMVNAAPLIDAGFWKATDWTSVGFPEEYFKVGFPGALPDALNGWLFQYNSNVAPTVPTNLDDLLKPEWKGKLAMASYQGEFFAGYGVKNGKDAMVKLINDLKSSGNLTLTNDPGSLISTGDKAIAFDAQNYNPNPALKVQGFEDGGMWNQFSGVNRDAANPAGAELFVIWNGYDPDWLTTRLTNKDFASTSVPFAGLPTDFLGKATGLIKANMDAWLESLDKGWPVFETTEIRDQYIQMADAANDTLQK